MTEATRRSSTHKRPSSRAEMPPGEWIWVEHKPKPSIKQPNATADGRLPPPWLAYPVAAAFLLIPVGICFAVVALAWWSIGSVLSITLGQILVAGGAFAAGYIAGSRH